MSGMGWRPYVPADPRKSMPPGVGHWIAGDAPPVKKPEPPTPRERARRSLLSRLIRRRHVPLQRAGRALHVQRAAVLAAGVVWIAEGLLEAAKRQWYFGLVVAALGWLATRSALTLGLTHSDARLEPTDRATTFWWWLFPLGAPFLVWRAAWILAAG